jgi:A/G-specific adenine glycosylase
MAAVTAKNIIKFQQKLLTWYDTDGRHFPWRNKRLTQYQIIIAETLLQRTKAETVSKFYSQFIKDFPNWTSLAQADTAAIELYLKPIGLYRQRAKRLKNLAVEMVKRKGKLPRDRAELESMPFMGQYIANAVELIIYKQPSPLIDVNMSRLIERYFGKRKMADIRYDPYLQKLSYKVVNHSRAKEINWSILDFAALICKSQKPNCKSCQLNSNCSYFKEVRNNLYLAGTINSKR